MVLWQAKLNGRNFVLNLRHLVKQDQRVAMVLLKELGVQVARLDQPAKHRFLAIDDMFDWAATAHEALVAASQVRMCVCLLVECGVERMDFVPVDDSSLNQLITVVVHVAFLTLIISYRLTTLFRKRIVIC